MKKSNELIHKMTGTAILIAILCVLQIIGNFIKIGPVNLNLALLPVIIGAILYGPIAGTILGFVNGLFALFAPDTIAVFWPVSIGGTIVTCLLKTTIAGLVCGFVYKPFKNKHPLFGSILVSLLMPILNTGIFIGCSYLFFRPIIDQYGQYGYTNSFSFLILFMIGWNFIFEVSYCIILSPTINKVISIVSKKKALKE